MAHPDARSFGAAADSYERGRPGYPADAVAWMLRGAREVVDVGAGTGKLTRAVVATGADVIAVDPDVAMLAALHEAVPGVPTQIGTAERLPRPDASADAVVLGQAWHWVDPVDGSREIGRVVRPAGILGLIWNVRDVQVDWVRRMGGIMHDSNAERMIATGGPVVVEPFGALESREWHWTTPMTRATLHAMARSRSSVITATDAERRRIGREMDALFDEIGARDDEAVDLPYVTVAFRAVRDRRAD